MSATTTVFVYAKGKKVRVLNLQDARRTHDALIADGWKHTSTLDACQWIEYLCNESEDLNEEIKSIII